MVATPEDTDDLRGYDVEVVIGDFDPPETLDDALKGVTPSSSSPRPGRASPAGVRLPRRRRTGSGTAHVVMLAWLGWEEPRSRLSDGHVKW